MYKQTLVLIIVIWITILATISIIFAQSLPNQFDDSYKAWPGFSSNFTNSNPIFNLNVSQSSSATPWSSHRRSYCW